MVGPSKEEVFKVEVFQISTLDTPLAPGSDVTAGVFHIVAMMPFLSSSVSHHQSRSRTSQFATSQRHYHIAELNNTQLRPLPHNINST